MSTPRGRAAARPAIDVPDLTTLRVVVAVAESGSMSAGSDRVGLALGAVSERIAALERASGTQLFERSSRGVRLTAIGQFLVQRARELLAEADRLALDLHDAAHQLQGHVRVMANASSIIQYLPGRLAAFQTAHPRIRVEVEERSSPEIALALLDGSADLGLLDMPYAVQGLDAVDLFSDTLVVVLPADHVLARQRSLGMDALMAQPLVCLLDGNAISGRLTAAAEQRGRRLPIRMQMRSFDAVCRMVAGGVGVSVLPREAIAPQLAVLPITTVRLAEPWAMRTHRAMLRQGLPARAPVRTLVRALRRG
ncbi:MAG: LysR family transcriptional regulator [Pseudomonadota bacterium]|nr:LysR family transcriptional regulator [Pseudomonadota bacterium]